MCRFELPEGKVGGIHQPVYLEMFKIARGRKNFVSAGAAATSPEMFGMIPDARSSSTAHLSPCSDLMPRTLALYSFGSKICPTDSSTLSGSEFRPQAHPPVCYEVWPPLHFIFCPTTAETHTRIYHLLFRKHHPVLNKLLQPVDVVVAPNIRIIDSSVPDVDLVDAH